MGKGTPWLPAAEVLKTPNWLVNYMEEVAVPRVVIGHIDPIIASFDFNNKKIHTTMLFFYISMTKMVLYT